MLGRFSLVVWYIRYDLCVLDRSTPIFGRSKAKSWCPVAPYGRNRNSYYRPNAWKPFDFTNCFWLVARKIVHNRSSTPTSYDLWLVGISGLEWIFGRTVYKTTLSSPTSDDSWSFGLSCFCWIVTWIVHNRSKLIIYTNIFPWWSFFLASDGTVHFSCIRWIVGCMNSLQ